MSPNFCKRIAFAAGLLAVALALAVGISSCNNSSAAALDQACSINTDCNSPLICAFARCHQACRESRDCSSGERCVKSGTSGVCQLPTESKCGASTTCQSGQVCGTDQECRTQCSASVTCSGTDICATIGTVSACYVTSNSTDEIVLIGAGILALDGAVIADGSAGTADASGTGSDAEGGGGSGDATMATGGDATMATGGDGGDATVNPGADGAMGGETSGGGPGDSATVFNPCPAAQEQFGFVAQGDVNPNYTSGVGVRTATQLLIFSGYTGAPVGGVDAGDAGSVDLVFVQAFDPATAKDLGPAAPLFRGPSEGAGNGLYLLDVAIAPSGQIALAFALYSGGGYFGGLYVTFLASSSGDAGAAVLQVGQTVRLSQSRPLRPQIVWSEASGTFVVSWVDRSANNLQVAELLQDGRPANGAAGVVPTAGLLADTNGSVGTSGKLVGIGYAGAGANRRPYLTILDGTGSQVGSPIQLAAPSTTTGWVAIAGTAQGFVTLYDDGAAGAVAFVATSPDGGIAGSGDAGDAGLPGFVLPGGLRPVDARAISDDSGGGGGVGALVATPNTVTFVYVTADGLGVAQHTSLFGQGVARQATSTNSGSVYGGFVTLSNYRGLFGASLYDDNKHATQMVASGCQ